MHPAIAFLADHVQFFAGLATGAVLSPLVILAVIRYLDFLGDTMPAAPRPSPPPRAGERRAYRPYYRADGINPPSPYEKPPAPAAPPPAPRRAP